MVTWVELSAGEATGMLRHPRHDQCPLHDAVNLGFNADPSTLSMRLSICSKTDAYRCQGGYVERVAFVMVDIDRRISVSLSSVYSHIIQGPYYIYILSLFLNELITRICPLSGKLI